MEQLQATLASSETAAEMAREASRLLAMASTAVEGNTASPSHAAPKPSEGDKFNSESHSIRVVVYFGDNVLREVWFYGCGNMPCGIFY